MKTAANDFLCLVGSYGEPIEAINVSRASHAIREGSVNSMKVDYLRACSMKIFFAGTTSFLPVFLCNILEGIKSFKISSNGV